jgi:hypothetical protein
MTRPGPGAVKAAARPDPMLSGASRHTPRASRPLPVFPRARPPRRSVPPPLRRSAPGSAPGHCGRARPRTTRPRSAGRTRPGVPGPLAPPGRVIDAHLTPAATAMSQARAEGSGVTRPERLDQGTLVFRPRAGPVIGCAFYHRRRTECHRSGATQRLGRTGHRRGKWMERDDPSLDILPAPEGAGIPGRLTPLPGWFPLLLSQADAGVAPRAPRRAQGPARRRRAAVPGLGC